MSKLQVSIISAAVLVCLIIWTVVLMHFQSTDDSGKQNGGSGGGHEHNHQHKEETVKKHCCNDETVKIENTPITPETPPQVVQIAENNAHIPSAPGGNSTVQCNQPRNHPRIPCCHLPCAF